MLTLYNGSVFAVNDDSPQPSRRLDRARITAAELAGSSQLAWPRWLVHLYTASGALAASSARVAVFDGAIPATACSGMIVGDDRGRDRRRAGAPRAGQGGAARTFDGARLDDIVDYLTFVFLPVLLLYHAGAAARRLGLAVASRRAAEQRVRLRLDRREDRAITSSPGFRRTGTSWSCICTSRTRATRSTR